MKIKLPFNTLVEAKTLVAEWFPGGRQGIGASLPEGLQQQYDNADNYPVSIHIMIPEHVNPNGNLAFYKVDFDKYGNVI